MAGSGTVTRALEPIRVAANEDAKRRRFDGERLVHALQSLNVPAVPALHLPIDVMWTVDGQPVAADIKKPKDFIDSYMDGRLHDQITAMQNMACKFFFLLIEGDPWSEDGGHSVGGLHGWQWDAFDDAMFDVQLYGGVKIARSPSSDRTPRRLAALWRWTGTLMPFALLEHPLPTASTACEPSESILTLVFSQGESG